jgi:hypothetical protein
MKQLLLLLLAGSIALAACNGGADVTAKAGDLTTIQWLDSTKELGQINEGQIVNLSYRFKNTGTKPLVIKNATASCGCTVAERPEKPIAPGEEGVIKATFNSGGKVGHNSKDIYVYANTEGREDHKLTFVVDVVKASPVKQ